MACDCKEDPEWREYFEACVAALVVNIEIMVTSHGICSEGRAEIYRMYTAGLQLAADGVTPPARREMN